MRVSLRAVTGGEPKPPPPELLCAITCAALYPHLAYAAAPAGGDAAPPRLLLRDADGADTEPQSAQLHPSSVGSRLGASSLLAPYVCFHEAVRTTKLYVRDSSPAPPLVCLVLCGAALEESSGGADTLLLDGWLGARLQPARAAPLLRELRRRFEACMQRLVQRAGAAGVGRERGRDGRRAENGGHQAGLEARPDVSPIVKALVTLFAMRPTADGGGAKKTSGKKKKKKKAPAGRGTQGGRGGRRAGWGGAGGLFGDPYNDSSGRGGLFEM